MGKIGKDQGTFENCGVCIAEAVIAFANTNCSAVCNPCPTLPSTSIQASVCATVGGIDGTSAGVEEACVQPCTNFPQQGVFGCYEGVCGDYPGFTEIP